MFSDNFYPIYPLIKTLHFSVEDDESNPLAFVIIRKIRQFWILLSLSVLQPDRNSDSPLADVP